MRHGHVPSLIIFIRLLREGQIIQTLAGESKQRTLRFSLYIATTDYDNYQKQLRAAIIWHKHRDARQCV